jgi:hypothetical protein
LASGTGLILKEEDMGKIRLIVLVISVMPMILNLIVYLLSKNKRFVKTFFGNETAQIVWLPWLLVTIGWFLLSVVISFLFDL